MSASHLRATSAIAAASLLLAVTGGDAALAPTATDRQTKARALGTTLRRVPDSPSTRQAAMASPWAAMEREMAAPWLRLQKPDGSFRDYVLDAAPRRQLHLYGTAALGLALLQSGVRNGDRPMTSAALRALGHALEHIVPGRKAVFQNVALATAYNMARGPLARDAQFEALRPALVARLRRMRLEVFNSGRDYYNYFLVEAVLVLELRRSGLTSKTPGTILASLPAAVRRAKRVIGRQLPNAIGRYARRTPGARRLAIASDPPWNPLAYHAFTLGLLARAVELLGPEAPGRARVVLDDAARASAELIAPDGDVAYFGRSQEQAWALSLTAYGAAAAAEQPGVAPLQAGRYRAVALRVLARTSAVAAGGPYGLYITPALRQSLTLGIAGLDRYATAVAYSATALTGLDWAAERLGSATVPNAALASDRPHVTVLSRGNSAFAVVRTSDVWFAIKQGPGTYERGEADYSQDLRYDSGLVALKVASPAAGWHDVLHLRPFVVAPDGLGPNLLKGRRVYRAYGTRLAPDNHGGVTVTYAFRAAAGRRPARIENIAYQPTRCGVRTVVPTVPGDRLEYTVYLDTPTASVDAFDRRLGDRSQLVTFDRAATITLGHHRAASGTDPNLVRARIRFAPAARETLTIDIADRTC